MVYNQKRKEELQIELAGLDCENPRYAIIENLINEQNIGHLVFILEYGDFV